ncbi:MAG: YMGG-like glycine zipper-containing protein [Planctomycetota bacterium]
MKRLLPSWCQFPLVVPFVAVLAFQPWGAMPNAQAQENTRNGALLGGVTGAVIGGVVGNNHKHQTAEGALIGGAVGAVAGGLIGNHRDQAVAQQRYYEQQAQQRYYRAYPQTYTAGPYSPGYVGQPTIITTTPVYGAPRTYYRSVPPDTRTVSRRPVTMAEVINMSRSGVSETVIVAHIQTNGVATRPDVNDVILLSQEGVSDYVITAMQTVGTTSVAPSPNVVYPSSANTIPTPGSTSGSMPVGTVYRDARSQPQRFSAPPLLERRGF